MVQSSNKRCKSEKEKTEEADGHDDSFRVCFTALGSSSTWYSVDL